MDTGDGKFVELDDVTSEKEVRKKFKYPGGKFDVGEILELKSSYFRVTKITPKKLILKLLPRK